MRCSHRKCVGPSCRVSAWVNCLERWLAQPPRGDRADVRDEVIYAHCVRRILRGVRVREGCGGGVAEAMSKRSEKERQDEEDDYPSDDDFDQADDLLDDWDDEPIGSCDECSQNVYRHDDFHDGLCEQCAWLAMMSREDDEDDD